MIPGLLIFALVKFGGYWLYVALVSPRGRRGRAWWIAALRVVAGIALGLGVLALGADDRGAPTRAPFLVGVLVSRVLLWSLLVRYAIGIRTLKCWSLRVLGGCLTSYALDVPAVWGLIAATGRIC